MPQDSLLPDEPAYTGFQMSWEQLPSPEGPFWACVVRRRVVPGEWQTVHMSRWDGTMMDLASTMAEDCLNAFLYDDAPGLPKAAATVRRLARLHRARFSRSSL